MLPSRALGAQRAAPAQPAVNRAAPVPLHGAQGPVNAPRSPFSPPPGLPQLRPRQGTLVRFKEDNAPDAAEALRMSPSLQALKGTTMPVIFRLGRRCCYGEIFGVCGSAEELGKWDPKNAVPMKWSNGDVWSAVVNLPAATTVEYKYVRMDSKGQFLGWEQDGMCAANNSLTVAPGYAQLCGWGAEVADRGYTPNTPKTAAPNTATATTTPDAVPSNTLMEHGRSVMSLLERTGIIGHKAPAPTPTPSPAPTATTGTGAATGVGGGGAGTAAEGMMAHTPDAAAAGIPMMHSGSIPDARPMPPDTTAVDATTTTSAATTPAAPATGPDARGPPVHTTGPTNTSHNGAAGHSTAHSTTPTNSASEPRVPLNVLPEPAIIAGPTFFVPPATAPASSIPSAHAHSARRRGPTHTADDNNGGGPDATSTSGTVDDRADLGMGFEDKMPPGPLV